MKFYRLILVGIGGIVGAIGGLVWTWELTFNVIVPGLGLEPQWHKLSGLLIFLMGVGEVGGALGALAGMIVAAAVALLSALLLSRLTHRNGASLAGGQRRPC